MDIDIRNIDLSRLSGCKVMHLHYSPWPAKVVWVHECTQWLQVPIIPEMPDYYPGRFNSTFYEMEIEQIELKPIAYPEKDIGYLYQWVGWGPKTGTLVKRRVENPNAIPRSRRLVATNNTNEISS